MPHLSSTGFRTIGLAALCREGRLALPAQVQKGFTERDGQNRLVA